MLAGANLIDGMPLLRLAAMGKVFNACYGPSTLGSFLRAFTFGHAISTLPPPAFWQIWPAMGVGSGCSGGGPPFERLPYSYPTERSSLCLGRTSAWKFCYKPGESAAMRAEDGAWPFSVISGHHRSLSYLGAY